MILELLLFSVDLQVRERFLKESAFEDVTLEAERKRIFKDFMHVLEVCLPSQWKHHSSVSLMEDRGLNVLCFPLTAIVAAARMPAPPLQDEEALQEVQEAPQEALALPIGSFTPSSSPRHPAGLMFLLFIALSLSPSGLRVRGGGVPQEEEEVTVQVSV